MRLTILTKAVFAGLVLAVAACGQREEATAPNAPAAVAESFMWRATEPSTVEAGPPAVLHLSTRQAFALLRETSVRPGDVVTARFSMQGPAGRSVRVVLQRHCEPESGQDAEQSIHELTGQPQAVETSLRFQNTFSCVRLSFVSLDGEPLDLTVTDLVVTKNGNAAGAPSPELRPSTDG
jgi:hypothetical protein